MNGLSRSTGTTVYWTILDHEGWRLHIAATDAGLCYVGSPNQPLDELAQWLKRQPALRGCALQREDHAMKLYSEALATYLSGAWSAREAPPLDLHGTPFQLAVWQALCAIPYGRTVSYTDIANKLGKPSAVRAVGSAIGANPVLITVPCHRVVGKNGALTGYRGGMDMKARLLALESMGTVGSQPSG